MTQLTGKSGFAALRMMTRNVTRVVTEARPVGGTRLSSTVKRMRATARPLAAAVLLAATGAMSAAPASAQQNLFTPVVKVNDLIVTRYEINQRIALMSAIGGGATEQAAIDALINERLQQGAALRAGLQVTEKGIEAGVEEFAARGNLSAEELIAFLAKRGVDRQSFVDFVSAGVSWRALVRDRFSGRAQITDAEVDAALQRSGPTGGLRILLSELFLPARDAAERAKSERLAAQIAANPTLGSFAAAARNHSVSPSRNVSGRLPWTPAGNLPPVLRNAVLGMSVGDVTAPLSTGNAIGLFQLRGIEETDSPTPNATAIEYAAYYIAGGRSEAALKKAAQTAARVDTCDDLYGEAKGQPENVLQIDTLPYAEIPQDVALELAKLDNNEISTALTRANGETLVFLMLCGRSYAAPETAAAPAEGEAATDDGSAEAASAASEREATRNALRSRRLTALADNYLAELKADAIITRFD